MNRLALAGGLVLALGVSAAYANTGFLSEAGGPQVPPYENLRSDTTLQKQRQSGYFPEAAAPSVAPYTGSAGADTTLQKQRQSGYFPTAGAPQVAPTTTGAQ